MSKEALHRGIALQMLSMSPQFIMQAGVLALAKMLVATKQNAELREALSNDPYEVVMDVLAACALEHLTRINTKPGPAAQPATPAEEEAARKAAEALLQRVAKRPTA